MSVAVFNPVRVEARLDDGLSRWLWLVKWALAFPHYVLLAFLWTAYALLSIVAFFAIAFAGRYPRALFEFNVGVLRWSWRVAYYAYGVLGTDRYPPFTLQDVPDYPARLQIAYPARLSRGLVFVKWWLLALPHYLIVGILLGGAWFAGRWAWVGGGGLIGLLTLVAVVVLALTGEYPRPLFDLILGLNRWVLRVAAYAGLMTDEYPPFRLDMGGTESGSTLTVSSPPEASGRARSSTRSGWTAARITSLVLGAILLPVSLGSFATGGAALWADRTMRDPVGFVTSPEVDLSTPGFAITTESITVDLVGAGLMRSLLGDTRVRVRDAGGAPVFVGIAPSADVRRYLGSVQRSIVTGFRDDAVARAIVGGAPASAPASQGFWTRSSSGLGPRSVAWPVRGGDWTLVAMRADGARGVHIVADLGATAPGLGWIAAGLLAVAFVLLATGLVLVVVPIRASSRNPEKEE